MNIKKYVTFGIVGCLFFMSAGSAVALQKGAMRINNIELRDVLSDKVSEQNIITLDQNDQYVFDYSETENAFFVRVHSGDFADVMWKAQHDIQEYLDVSRNEACYVGIYGTGPTYVLPEDDERTFYFLPSCHEGYSSDVNEDFVVNGTDLSQCIAEYEFINDDGLQNGLCDINANQRIDALDLSKVIQYLGAELDKNPYLE